MVNWCTVSYSQPNAFCVVFVVSVYQQLNSQFSYVLLSLDVNHQFEVYPLATFYPTSHPFVGTHGTSTSFAHATGQIFCLAENF